MTTGRSLAQRRIGIVLATILGLIAVLHAYWALGGRWGLAEALGGADRPVPAPGLIWVVVVLLTGAVLVVLGCVGVWGQWLPAPVFRLGAWALAVVLLLVAFMNVAASTAWERFVFAPLALGLAVGSMLVARASSRAT